MQYLFQSRVAMQPFCLVRFMLEAGRKLELSEFLERIANSVFCSIIREFGDSGLNWNRLAKAIKTGRGSRHAKRDVDGSSSKYLLRQSCRSESQKGFWHQPRPPREKVSPVSGDSA